MRHKIIVPAELWQSWFNIKPQTSIDKKFAFSFTTNGVSASLSCRKEIIINDEKTPMKLPPLNKKVGLIGSDPGARCPMAGIKVQSLDDIGDKDKKQRFCEKNSTFRYRSGEFERAKKRVIIAGDVDNIVQNLTKLEFSHINLKNPLNYYENAIYRLKCFEIKYPIYELDKLIKLKWSKQTQSMRQTDRQINKLLYNVGAKNRKKKLMIQNILNIEKICVKKLTMQKKKTAKAVVDKISINIGDDFDAKRAAGAIEKYKKQAVKERLKNKNYSAKASVAATKLRKARKLAKQLRVASRNKDTKSKSTLKREKIAREKQQKKRKEEREKEKKIIEEKKLTQMSSYEQKKWPRKLRRLITGDIQNYKYYHI
ncbi:hypothetical protein HCN44_008052 [Aphidius gifuensis]|uniref:Uncharacterized protein n=1 Tax=Aphidius gifuensis TaxID=684658 RepID=A0A834XN07_APHGI|nr:hypothetical protein HCN44_008052 [Aphidius gifuensis]